jgi:serine/threonine-protein kinase
MTLAVGTRLGRYEIHSPLGAGGMGEVYLAEDTTLHRRVALKVLPTEVAANPDRMRRFKQEATAAASLNHPNIAHIYEIGEANGVNFIAMEYIEGVTLRDKIHRERVELPKCLRFLQHVAEALAKAHAAGIVHRDLKPDNIIISLDGHAKILDFGLAKLVEPTPTSGLSDTGSEVATAILAQLSKPGLILGTAGYMSPEQAQGKTDEIDHRSDIFSFGCILYEAAAGHQAFEGKDVLDSLHKIVHEPAPHIKDFNVNAPDELQRIVRRCLAKDPEKRYQSIKDVALELEELRQVLKDADELGYSVQSASTGAPAASRRNAEPNTVSVNDSSIGTTSVGTARTTSSAEYIVTEVKRHKTVAALALLTLFIAVSALVYFIYFSGANKSAIDSIAVLPFVNQSGDPNAEYLSDGIPETITYSLSQLPNLKVTARNSAFRYKGKDIDSQTVGRELGVQAVLSGRLTQRGDSLMVSAEVVDTNSNRLLWGGQYSRKLSDILAVQEEIAKEISEKLRLSLTSEQQKQLTTGSTVSSEAYQLYLKGRYFWNKRTGDATNKSIEYFNQAIEKDPNYALAYAGLADSYVILTGYTPTSGKEAYPKARVAATKALELNDKLAEAYTTRAYIKAYFDWDFANAERDFKRSIELNPNYPTARQWYGEYLSAMGRHAEAIDELKKAQELDPLSLIINKELGTAFSFAGQHDQAIEQLRKTLDMDSGFVPAHRDLGIAYTEKGKYGEAIAELEKALVLEKDNAFSLTALSYTYAVSGKREDAQRLLDQLIEKSKKFYVPPTFIASVYAGLGDKDQAFQWLEKAYNDRDEGLVYLKIAKPWVRLSSDPRFVNLVRRVGLPQQDPGKQ